MDKFEQHLRQHQIKPVPSEWRDEIFNTCSQSETQRSKIVKSHFWPLAWAAVACLWAGIAALEISSRPEQLANKTVPTPDPDTVLVMMLRHQEMQTFLLKAQELPPQSPNDAGVRIKENQTADLV